MSEKCMPWNWSFVCVWSIRFGKLGGPYEWSDPDLAWWAYGIICIKGSIMQIWANNRITGLKLAPTTLCKRTKLGNLLGFLSRIVFYSGQPGCCNMMTSSNGNIFRVTGPLCGEFTGPGEFPTQRPVTRSFDVFFDLRPNKRLSKQSWGWWFETLSRSLWRHCNELSTQYSW